MKMAMMNGNGNMGMMKEYEQMAMMNGNGNMGMMNGYGNMGMMNGYGNGEMEAEVDDMGGSSKALAAQGAFNLVAASLLIAAIVKNIVMSKVMNNNSRKRRNVGLGNLFHQDSHLFYKVSEQNIHFSPPKIFASLLLP